MPYKDGGDGYVDWVLQQAVGCKPQEPAIAISLNVANRQATTFRVGVSLLAIAVCQST